MKNTLDKQAFPIYNISCTFLQTEVYAMLNLTKVFAQEGSVPFDFPLDLTELEFYGNHPFKEPLTVTGIVENFAGIVLLKAQVNFVYSAPCDRCGVLVEKPYQLSFEHVIVTSVEDDESDGFVVAEDMQLDVEELMNDDIVLWVPTKFLCKKDCKGLCDQCGQNLNEGSCQCKATKGDPRLAVLESLLNND